MMPPASPFAADLMMRQQITIRTETNLQSATLFTPEVSRHTAVLFTHGYLTDSKGYYEYAEELSRNGTTCLAYDLRGHGENDQQDIANLSISDYLDGLRASYDALAERPEVDPERIGLCAASFGAYLAVLLCAERSVKSLLLRAPALYPDRLRDVPRYMFDTDEILKTAPDPDNTALGIIRSFGRKVLLISSEYDRIIIPEVIEADENAIGNGGRIELIRAEHRLNPKARQLFKTVVSGWATQL